MTSDEQLGAMAELFIRAGKRLRAEEARRYAPYGLTPTQGWTLCVLADSTEPLRMKDLAAILGVVPRAVTPQIDVLEAAGLVRRRPDPNNRRSTFIDLTDDGTKIRASLVQQRKLAAADLFAPLTAPQRTAMLKALGTIANAEQPDPSPPSEDDQTRGPQAAAPESYSERP